jgi:heme/copper-type cytochrome/quinol oxidase subunit 4
VAVIALRRTAISSRSNVRELTDEALFQRAGHAGRNMIAIAILGTLAVLAIGAFVFIPTGQSPVPWPFVAGFAAVVVCVAGLWILAVAANRGDPTSVAIVMGVMSVQVVIAVIGYSLSMAMADQNDGNPANLGFTIVGIAIIVALANSRNVLVELKRRNLWEQRFGTGPSWILVLVGGMLYVVCYVGLYAGLFLSAVWSVQRRAAEKRQADAFLHMVKTEEADFLAGMNGLNAAEPKTITAAIGKVDSMDQEVQSMHSDVRSESPLSPILAKYRQALAKWKSGLVELQARSPNHERVKAMFEEGDKLRKEAGTEFDRTYTPNQKRGG